MLQVFRKTAQTGAYLWTRRTLLAQLLVHWREIQNLPEIERVQARQQLTWALMVLLLALAVSDVAVIMLIWAD